MKRNDLLIAIGTLAYSLLFYKQLAGINFFLFSFLLAALLAIKRPELLKNLRWLLFAGATLFTSFCVVWQGTTLAVIANVIALMLLAASGMSPRSSVILNFFYSLYSITGSFIFIILRMVDPAFREKKEMASAGPGKNFSWKKFLTFFLPVIIILLFFFIFRTANPLFKKFTDEINLDFISFAWIGFTFPGFLLVCGFFYQYRIRALDKWELEKPKRLAFYENQKILKFINEKNAALFLFAMLNLMLLFINGVDVHYLYMGAGLPKGISHADFVHNGVGMLILSILISISLMLFFFRGNMNFDEKVKGVKLLVYLWIAQNILMIVSTILRNNLYVAEYQLTYRRIGVYIYLVMAIFGLVTTFWKIYDQRNNWFLFRSNAMAGFLFLCAAAAVDVDLLISRYNIRHARSVSALDKTYLLSLSETNLPELYALKNDTGFSHNQTHHYERFFSLGGEFNGYTSRNVQQLDARLLSFMESSYNRGWRSWNLRRERIGSELQKLNEQGSFTSMDLTAARIENLRALHSLNRLKELKLDETYYARWGDLEVLPQLEKLSARNSGILDFDSFPQMKNLKELDVANNSIVSWKSISRFAALEKLTANSNTGSFPALPQLRELSLRNANVSDPSFLGKQPRLETLDLYGSRISRSLPSMPQLKMLIIANNSSNFSSNVYLRFPVLPKLEDLDLSFNDINNIRFLFRNLAAKETATIAPELKSLNLRGNSLIFTAELAAFNKLEELDLSYNKLNYCPDLTGLPQLRRLLLEGNFFQDLAPLGAMAQLEELDISSGSALTDFSALKLLTGLKRLNVSTTSMNDLSLLFPLQQLQVLNMQNTSLSLKGISQLSSLQELHLTSLKEEDLLHLSGLKQLKKIYVNTIQAAVKEKFQRAFPAAQLTAQNITE